MSGPLNVLLCCTANVSRSPTLELVMRRYHPAVAFSSRGLFPFSGTHHLPLVQELQARGYKPDSTRRAVLLSDADLKADLILLAEDRHYNYLMDQATREIKQPCYLMMNILGEQSDMPDPYGNEISPREFVDLCETMAKEFEPFLRRIGLRP